MEHPLSALSGVMEQVSTAYAEGDSDGIDEACKGLVLYMGDDS